ncbi:MAG TPA: hypothetical protein IGR64_14280 [Leptolyngbyaceae cyanobacterium M65_K2018_010]|nr:hypothetical protein [Leptolyngbyaceae cyanobacterium M65_K2018_010]
MKTRFQAPVIGLMVGTLLVFGAGLAQSQIRPAPVPSVPASSLPRTVGQVDTTKAIEIVVVNQVSEPISMGFSGGIKVVVNPGNEVMVSFPEAPVNLFVYPLGAQANIKYDAAVADNRITLAVTTINDVAPGDRSINVDRTGLVYIF